MLSFLFQAALHADFVKVSNSAKPSAATLCLWNVQCHLYKQMLRAIPLMIRFICSAVDSCEGRRTVIISDWHCKRKFLLREMTPVGPERTASVRMYMLRQRLGRVGKRNANVVGYEPTPLMIWALARARPLSETAVQNTCARLLFLLCGFATQWSAIRCVCALALYTDPTGHSTEF